MTAVPQSGVREGLKMSACRRLLVVACSYRGKYSPSCLQLPTAKELGVNINKLQNHKIALTMPNGIGIG